jgi:polar amino acid transport system substrate-binding protein
MFRRLLFGFALIFLTIPAYAQESLLDTVLKRDKLLVATYSTSPPLAYVDDSGNLVGFEIDMAREIAKDLLGDPNKVEFVVVQSDGRFPAALSGKVDFGLCSTTIYPDRAVRIAFTRPYLDTGGSVIARKDAEIKHVKELNDPKFTYAVLNVPPAINRVKSELPSVKQLLLDSPSALFLAVKTGRATALWDRQADRRLLRGREPGSGASRRLRDVLGLCLPGFDFSEARRFQMVVVPGYLGRRIAFWLPLREICRVVP